jgi:hypothetical protein
MNTQRTVDGAIARSISHDEIVTVHVGPEDTMHKALIALVTGDPENGSANYDWTAVSRTEWDVWGTTADGEEWRVTLRAADHVVY